MRVAVVLRSPPPQSDRDGAARLKRLAVAFAEHGHDVTVYCVGWWGEDTRRIQLDGVTYEAVVHDRPALFYTRLTGLLGRHRPDVVLASPDPPKTIISARIGALAARAPLVCDWYGDEPRAEASRWAGAAARLPTRVVTPSELRRTRVREHGASGESTVVIPNSIDFSLIESTDPGERREVVYARDLDESANLESLLLALAELRKQDDWTATVIGDGPQRGAYETQARELGIADRVEFVGDLGREKRVAVYRGAHTFAQTSKREAFADELLWALAAGCVGVVEYQEGSSAHELVERRERGIRVTDMEDLDDAIADAWAMDYRDLDTDFREFDHDAVVEDYLELFRECGAE